jgi:hypothetical protein
MSADQEKTKALTTEDTEEHRGNRVIAVIGKAKAHH